MNETHNGRVIGEGKLWFGLAASGTAFLLEVVSAFVISWATCFAGHGRLGDLTQGEVRWLLAGITVLLFFISVGGGRMSYQHWRHISGEKDLAHSESSPNDEFISMLGVLCSTAMSVGILWISIPLILIDICVRSL